MKKEELRLGGEKMSGKKPQTKKSKVKKIETKKPEKKIQNQVTGEWLYFCQQEVTVKTICEIFNESSTAEVWEEAGVLEISLGEKGSFDLEATQIHPKDEVTLQFAEEQGTKRVFLVTFSPEDYEAAQVIMKQILEKFGGLFCGDTEDFIPQIK